MRNRKFRLSDMIPSAWFFKLRQIAGGRARSSNNQNPLCSKKIQRQPPPPPPPPQSRSRKSYYFTRELQSNNGFCVNSPPPSSPVPPQARKASQKQSPVRRTSSRSSSSATVLVGCTATESIWTKSDSPPEFSTSLSDDTSPEPEFKFRTHKIPTPDRDIVIEVSSKYSDRAVVRGGGNGGISKLNLPPIITNHKKKHTKQRTAAESPTKKLPANSPGVRLRVHSPKIGHRQIGGRRSTSSRRSLTGSLAVMKSSYDPQKDFRESMVEMIVENKMKCSKDLEDLLACYLCLNEDEYHDLIIKVFKQIWFDLMEPV